MEGIKNGDFLKLKTKQTSSYVVEDVVQRNREVIWGSPPGEGKSILSQALVYHVAYEAPYLGKNVTGGNVLVIDSENRLDILQGRIRKIRKGLDNQGYTKKGEVVFQHYSGFLLDDDSTWQGVRMDIAKYEPSLILIDHLLMFHHQDENRSAPMNKVATAIEQLMDICGSSVLVMHHLNKTDRGSFVKRLRGSSAIYAKSDAACEVRTISKVEGRIEKVGLIPQSRKDITPAPIRVRIEDGSDWLKLVYDGTYQPIEDPEMDRIYHDIFHIFLKLKSPQTVNSIRNSIEGYASEREIRGSLRGLESMGLLTKRIGAGGKYIYSMGSAVCPWCSS